MVWTVKNQRLDFDLLELKVRHKSNVLEEGDDLPALVAVVDVSLL